MKIEAKYSLNMFAMPVLVSALILSLSFIFAETFLGVIETFDLSLKKLPKPLWVIIMTAEDPGQIFYTAISQHGLILARRHLNLVFK